MKLADWARSQGVDYKTAYRWFRDGILPIPSVQLPTGTILVTPAAASARAGTAVYGRVSSLGHKKDLERQVSRLVEHATRGKLAVTRIVKEVGSGLNGHRRKLMALLKDPEIGIIVVERRDRLARFGSEYIEAALRSAGRRILIVDSGETKDDLVRDMLDLLTSLCGRLYGKRSAKSRAARAVKAMESVG